MDYLSGFAPNVEIPKEKIKTDIKSEDKSVDLVCRKKRQKEPELVNKDDRRKLRSAKDELRNYKPNFVYRYEKSSPKGT